MFKNMISSDEEDNVQQNDKKEKKKLPKSLIEKVNLLEASCDKVHMRHLGEKHFDNMDFP